MTRKGVWNLQQVRDKYLQSLWANDIHMYGWGYNINGTVGNNTRSTVMGSSPVQIGTDTNWNSFEQKLSMGAGYFMLATKSDGTLWSWGLNGYGQLGQNQNELGATPQRSSPTQIGSGTDWNTAISRGSQMASAVKTDGTLWMWGINQHGALGQNDRIYYSSPVQVPGTTWSKSYLGSNMALGIKTNGELWMWGVNTYGQLGQNSTLSPGLGGISSPVQVPGTTWSKSHVGNRHTLAIKTDGTLWSWGYGSAGALGQNQPNSGSNYSSPVQIPGTNWKDCYAGNQRSAATTTDGELFIWGPNINGCLGQNQSQSNYDNASSPIQIAGTTWDYFTWITTGGWQSIKTDGTLWGCGRMNYGAGEHAAPATVLADGISSPIQIGSDSTWDSITSWGYGTSALKSTLTPSQL